MLGLEPVEPGHLTRTDKLRIDGLDQVEEVLGMAAPRFLDLASGLELIEAELADRLEHREARFGLVE